MCITAKIQHFQRFNLLIKICCISVGQTKTRIPTQSRKTCTRKHKRKSKKIKSSKKLRKNRVK